MRGSDEMGLSRHEFGRTWAQKIEKSIELRKQWGYFSWSGLRIGLRF